jgi:hypothetical protein
MGGLLARVGIIGAIVIGGWFFRDYLSGAAVDLQVGDCFDSPTYEGVVDEVPHHPCTEEHDAEVFFVADYPDQEAFPGEDAFDVFTESNCIPTFAAYTGVEFYTSEYDVGVFYPTEEGWGAGDHEITCYLVRTDYAKMTAPVRKT